LTRENSGVAQYPTRRGPVPSHFGIGEWVVDDVVDVINFGVLPEVTLTIPIEECVEALKVMLFGEVGKMEVVVGGGGGVIRLSEGVGVVGVGPGESIDIGGEYEDVGIAEVCDAVKGPGVVIGVTRVAMPLPLEIVKEQTLSVQQAHGSCWPRLS
jgi:hypothetical protein